MLAASPPASRPRGRWVWEYCVFNVDGYDQLAERVDIYRQAVKNANPVGLFVNDQVAALCITHCGEDNEEARRVAGPEGMWFVDKANETYASWQGREVPDSYKFELSKAGDRGSSSTDVEEHMQSGAFAIGDPDTVIEVIKGYEKAGVDQMLCLMQMGNLAHSRIMDSIKLYGAVRDPLFPVAPLTICGPALRESN